MELGKVELLYYETRLQPSPGEDSQESTSNYIVQSSQFLWVFSQEMVEWEAGGTTLLLYP